jgi:hypothetical protein
MHDEIALGLHVLAAGRQNALRQPARGAPMTPFLIFARLSIIASIWWSMLPFEVACDTIDDELARR